MRESGVFGLVMVPAFGRTLSIAALTTGFATALSGAMLLSDRRSRRSPHSSYSAVARRAAAAQLRALGWHIVCAALALSLRIVQLALMTGTPGASDATLFTLSSGALAAWGLTILLGRRLARRAES